MRWVGSVLVIAAVSAFAASAHRVEAVEVHGSARVNGGPTDNNGRETDLRDERYALNLTQPITPWLMVLLSGRFNRFKSSPEGFDVVRRESNEPRLDLAYRNSLVSAVVSYYERRTRGTSPSDNLNVQSFIGQFSLRPDVGPKYQLRYRDESNIADVQIFGRDVDSRDIDFDVIFDGLNWGARYSYGRLDIDNNLTGFTLKQEEHRGRGRIEDRFYDGRLRVSFEGWLSLVDQVEENPAGSTLLEPLPPRQGLFVVDTTPDLGALLPSPGLIDGDVTTPVSPPIEIGGANTFRNIGVDLGITRPVTRLEITVDALSDSGLVWEVWQSPDNFTTSAWVQVPLVSLPVWDGSFLRYTLEIPQTNNRFFKAVNVSTNVFPNVAVTEIRALLDVAEIGRRDDDSTTYRGFLSTSFDPTERLRGTFNLGFRNDKRVAGGRVSRDLQELTSNGTLRYLLRPDLALLAGYRYADGEELEPILQRTEVLYNAGLEWSPRPTVDGSFTIQTLDEREEAELIRAFDSAILKADTDLLPDLKLISELIYSKINDPFSGFKQNTWRLQETLQSRPTERWTLEGVFAHSWFESVGFDVPDRRVLSTLRTTWSATPYLNLTGDWSFRRDDLRKDVTQRYNVVWVPGRRLTVSLNFQSFDTAGIARTTNRGANLIYRFRRALTLFANLSRSTSEQRGLPDSTITSLRYGLNLFF